MRPVDRAEILAVRADIAARNVSRAAEHLRVVKDAHHTKGVVVDRHAWLLLQSELTAWREATKRMTQALDAREKRGPHGEQER